MVGLGLGAALAKIMNSSLCGETRSIRHRAYEPVGAYRGELESPTARSQRKKAQKAKRVARRNNRK